MIKITTILLLSILWTDAYAGSYVENLSKRPVSQLDLGLFKLDMLLSSKVLEMNKKWGLKSGVSYLKAEAIVAQNVLNIIVYSKAPAKNLNLDSCNLGITEFESEFEAVESILAVWPKDQFGLSEEDFKNNTTLKLVIYEQSNSALLYQCDWPLAGNKVYEVR
ncbi:hypothetical protein [Sessilibacter sp. MAH4]